MVEDIIEIKTLYWKGSSAERKTAHRLVLSAFSNVTLSGEQNPEKHMGEAYRSLSDVYLRKKGSERTFHGHIIWVARRTAHGS